MDISFLQLPSHIYTQICECWFDLYYLGSYFIFIRNHTLWHQTTFSLVPIAHCFLNIYSRSGRIAAICCLSPADHLAIVDRWRSERVYSGERTGGPSPWLWNLREPSFNLHFKLYCCFCCLQTRKYPPPECSDCSGNKICLWPRNENIFRHRGNIFPIMCKTKLIIFNLI